MKWEQIKCGYSAENLKEMDPEKPSIVIVTEKGLSSRWKRGKRESGHPSSSPTW